MASPLSRNSSSMSSADMEALFAKIHKEQGSQLELLKHMRRSMEKSVSSRDSSDVGAASMASLSFEILGELLDEIILDVVAEAHRDVKSMRSVCPICKTKCRNYVTRVGQDIFGQNPQTNSSQSFDCVHCQRSFPAPRYAPHLEKCLGLSGRSSSRAASRRMGAGERAGSGSPFTPMSYSDDREASDSDKDLIEKKKKKNVLNSNGITGTNGTNGSTGSDYSATGSVKSSSSSTKVKKHKHISSENDSSEYPVKTQKSSLLAKASKGSSSSKLKGIGLQSPPSAQIGEISLGYLDDELLLANGRSLQNGAGGGSTNGSSTQKLSSSNPKRASGGTGASKRPPGSSSSKNGQVTSFYESLKAIGSHESASSDSGEDSRDEDYREDEEKGRRGVSGTTHSSSQSINPVVIRIKKSSAFSGQNSEIVDSEFIDIDGDEDDDAMEILQTPKKKKT